MTARGNALKKAIKRQKEMEERIKKLKKKPPEEEETKESEPLAG